MQLRVFKILKNTKVEGPNTRYCIWVQGCSIHCKGCQAIHTWSHTQGTLVDTQDIIKDIQKHSKEIEGITFLGGEPFEQAEALGEIAENVQKMGLGVLCFTGNYIDKLRSNKKNHKLLSNIDLLIDGPFIQGKTDYSRPWCGSSNQRYNFLTNRYNDEIFSKYRNKIEINLSENGTIFVNGIGNFDKILYNLNIQKIERINNGI